MKTKERPEILWSLSGVNPKGEPFVQLRLGEKSLSQFTPAEARTFGQQVLECAEAAETDAYIWHFFQEKMELRPQQVGMLIADFRKFRESHAGTKAPSRQDFSGPEFAEQRAEVMKNASQETDPEKTTHSSPFSSAMRPELFRAWKAGVKWSSTFSGTGKSHTTATGAGRPAAS